MANQTVNVRSAFKARPGYYLLDLDYSQIEFRLSAAMAGERPLVIGLRDGVDYYKMVAAPIFGKTVPEITKTERQLGKVVALGQNYGQEHWGLAHKLHVSNDEAKTIMDGYWSGQPMTKLAKDEALAEAYKLGGVYTYFGRFRGLPDLFIQGNSREERGRKNKAIRSVWNTKVQGTAADWIKIAMVRVHRALKGRDAYLILTVHDELVLEVSFNEPLYEIVAIVQQAMEFKVKGLPKSCQDLYPDGYFVPTDPEFGLNWGELYPLKDKLDPKSGKQQIGFLTILSEKGIAVNLNEPRKDMEVSFIARSIRNINAQIPERNKPQIEGKPDKKVLSSTSVKNNQPSLKLVSMPAEHPLDQLISFFSNKGNIKIDVPVPNLELVKSVESSVSNDPVIIVTEPVLVGSIPTRKELPLRSEENQQFLEIKSMANNVNDLTYPCMMINIYQSITDQGIKLIQALSQKFPGDFRCYIVYQGQTIATPLKLSESDIVKQYLRKGFGDTTKIELFDEQGRQLGRVSFQ